MADKIKVAQSLAGAPFGGAENFYTRLVCALAESDQIEQRAYTRPNDFRVPKIQSAGVIVEEFRFGNTLNFIDHHRYRRALESFSPDVVITYMNRASKLTPKSNRYKLVARLGHYYDLKYYRHADYWIGISKGICDHLIRGGMPSERVIHIPNFADEAIHEPLPRTSYSTPEGVPLLLAAGRLHTNKGFDTLIKALKNVPDAILWLAGDGPEKDALHELAKSEGVFERIRFLGWRNDVAALMRTTDMFICPSRHEGLGSIVMESWFNECPIIATNSQGPGELIEDGVTGLIVDIDDISAMTDTILIAINSKTKLSDLKASAKQLYSNTYSRSKIAERYTSAIRLEFT